MRTFVILGIVLVVISIGIAKFALDYQSPAASTKDKNGADAGALPKRVACWGFFEVKGGVAQLDAKQAGDVIFVAEENVEVEAGAPLLKVDDAHAQLKVDQAKIAVKYAELQLEEANQLTELYELQKKQQQAGVKVVDIEITETELKKKTALDVAKDDPKRESIEKLFDLGLGRLNEKKKAEQARLKQIELQSAPLKIKQAQADLDAKKVQLREAQKALDLYKIVAPSAGSILRANYRKGETLAPNPLRHAIEFLPKADIIVKAEVLQEWGRFVEEGQPVDIEDDTYNGPAWKGQVHSISKWYAPTRSPVIEPFRYNDVRTLEIIIKVSGAEKVKIGQRVRAMVHVK